MIAKNLFFGYGLQYERERNLNYFNFYLKITKLSGYAVIVVIVVGRCLL